MQIAIRTIEPDCQRSQTPQRVAERGVLQAGDFGVRDHQRLAGQFPGVLGQEVIERLGADLFLAFDQEIHIAGQIVSGLQPGLDRVDVSQMLALVVADAAGINIAAHPARLKGRRRPEVERIRRLHIVVAVNEECRFFRVGMRGLGHHHRGAGGLAEFRLQAGLEAAGDQPFATASHVIGMIRLGADAWDARVGKKLLDEALFVLRQVLQNGLGGYHTGLITRARSSGNSIIRFSEGKWKLGVRKLGVRVEWR